jgi:GxxExxY protein
MTQNEDIGDPQTYAIIGAAMEVHRLMKHGFLEIVYHDALAKEFARRVIPSEREKPLSVFYKGERLESHYKADFICFGEVVVEIKALSSFSGTEEAQLLNYLRVTDMKRGLLLNFGAPAFQFKRMVFNYDKHP